LSPSSQRLFEVERFRSVESRVVVAREVTHPTLVLGSTQPAELPSRDAVRARDVEVVRRRGGGGAVYLEPGNHLWLDAWVPRHDSLWSADVSAAAEWVGEWWLRAVGLFGAPGFSVHTGRSVPGELGDLVCFAGRGPGEVFGGDRKLVGLSQWRSREGALFSSCAYARWEPNGILSLFSLDAVTRKELAEDLGSAAVGLQEIEAPGDVDMERLRDDLLGSFPSFSPSSSGSTAEPGAPTSD
jgi:lipoate-protein ligase A